MSEIIRNKSLKQFNTFGVDTKANYYLEINNDIDVFEFLTDYNSLQKPIYILGGGANTLFVNDFEGTVVKIATKGIAKTTEDENNYFVEAYAGENWDNFVDYCVENNYYGAENLVSIPGSVGAAPIQNIGAYGVEAKDIIDSVVYYNINKFTLHKLKAEECGFGYRDSIFKKELKNNILVVKVIFKLDKKPNFKLTYGSINKELELKGITKPSIEDVANTIASIRAAKLPDFKKIGNAGSFFKNPIISLVQFEKLRIEFPKIVSYSVGDGLIKIAAAWLIDNAGLKGYQIGGAAIHQQQALVIINKDNAIGNDVKLLSEYIQKEIKEIYGINLIPEVIFV